MSCDCCHQTKSQYDCGLCKIRICKSCTEFVDSSVFSFFMVLPEELKFNQYCLSCYAVKIKPQVIRYAELMKLAKQVYVIDKPHRQPLPVLRKAEESIKVKECPDKEEATLRLAFRAAELGFNAVLKANITYTKIRNFGYQKMVWGATGVPADLDTAVLKFRKQE